MNIRINKKFIPINTKKLSNLGKFLGLMFKSRNSENLLFEFNKPSRTSIHSFFVFFPFLAIWLNEKNQVLEYKTVYPFTPVVKPKTEFTKLIEVPFNEKNRKIIKKLVDKGKI